MMRADRLGSLAKVDRVSERLLRCGVEYTIDEAEFAEVRCVFDARSSNFIALLTEDTRGNRSVGKLEPIELPRCDGGAAGARDVVGREINIGTLGGRLQSRFCPVR
jgi:hypothetical protein